MFQVDDHYFYFLLQGFYEAEYIFSIRNKLRQRSVFRDIKRAVAGGAGLLPFEWRTGERPQRRRQSLGITVL
jgi:hypothetical protein